MSKREELNRRARRLVAREYKSGGIVAAMRAIRGLVVAWLLGEIPELPTIYMGKPEDETERIREHLLRMNRAGMLTTFSQPGEKGMSAFQRATVTGIVPAAIRDQALSVFNYGGMLCLSAQMPVREKDAGVPPRMQYDIPISLDTSGAVSAGIFGVAPAIEYQLGGLLPRKAWPEVAKKFVAIEIIDPEWGTDRMWPQVTENIVRMLDKRPPEAITFTDCPPPKKPELEGPLAVFAPMIERVVDVIAEKVTGRPAIKQIDKRERAGVLTFGTMGALPISPDDPRLRAVLVRKSDMKRGDAEALVKRAFAGIPGVDVKRVGMMTKDAEAERLLEKYHWFKLRSDRLFSLKVGENGERKLAANRVKVRDANGDYAGIIVMVADLKPREMRRLGLEPVRLLLKTLRRSDEPETEGTD